MALTNVSLGAKAHSSLGTGLMKSLSTKKLGIAVSGTDYLAPTIPDAVNISVGTTTGTKIGTATTQKLGFYNATPVVQPTSANQAAVTTTVGSAVATTAATNTSPYGYDQAQADAIVTNINALRVDVLAINTLVTALRLALVNLGIVKGS